jgi:hypothetical protein
VGGHCIDCPKIGKAPQTPLIRVRQHERDNGLRDGVTSAEWKRIKTLEPLKK